jgi:HEPN domain-containing protein
MSQPEQRAQAFLHRADADLAAVRALERNREVPDEIVGFHAQQCAEELLKAVLAGHDIEFPRTHSLQYLLDRLSDHGLAPAPVLHDVKELYPYAVQFRYEAPIDDGRSTEKRHGNYSNSSAPGRPSSCRVRDSESGAAPRPVPRLTGDRTGARRQKPLQITGFAAVSKTVRGR